jgi:glycosyltransferase involved in cell wall biosynthesis
MTAIDRLGLTSRVQLVGARCESFVRDLVRRAQGFVLASVVAPDGDRDGIPVALMEAMAAATPVVASRVGGIEELVDGTGVLVPAADPKELASAINRLRDFDVRSSLGTRGRARVANEFSSDVSAEAILATADIYRVAVT